MYIIDDGLKLDAVLDMPAAMAGEKCPLVIVIHGFTGYKEEDHIVAVSRALNEIGYATLRVDMYGHGHSDGEFRKHTLYKWLTNALTVIDYARSLDFVTDLYLCGHSQGGLTVMLAGGLKHDVIKGLIPLSHPRGGGHRPLRRPGADRPRRRRRRRAGAVRHRGRQGLQALRPGADSRRRPLLHPPPGPGGRGGEKLDGKAIKSRKGESAPAADSPFVDQFLAHWGRFFCVCPRCPFS